MSKLLEQTWKTKKGAENALPKLLEEDKKNNYRVFENKEEGTFSLIQTQVPRGIRKTSKIEKPCLYVWEQAQILWADGKTRSQILKQLEEDGIAYHTARTQYQLWYTSMKNSGEI